MTQVAMAVSHFIRMFNFVAISRALPVSLVIFLEFVVSWVSLMAIISTVPSQWMFCPSHMIQVAL